MRTEMLADIRCMSMSNMCLPAQIFFEPNVVFSKWIKDFPKVIDCGAGVGHLGKLYPNVLGIDICDRDKTESTVLFEDATIFSFPKDSIAIIARPSGGDWINDTVENAWNQGIRIFYIGLPKNYERDLTDFKATLILECVGEEGEQLWEFKR